MHNESDADDVKTCHKISECPVGQASRLSGMLLAKNIALLLMFDALSPSILNIDVFCPFFYPFCPV